MLKRKIACYFLTLLFLTYSGVAFANTPYASIMAYTQNNTNNKGISPTMNTLAVLNVINLTPWEIYIGSPTNNFDIMNGFSGPPVSQPTSTDSLPVNSFWLKGINGVNNSSVANSGANVNTGFAFHSVQIGLNNPNNAWITSKNTASTYQNISYMATCEMGWPAGGGQDYAATTAYISVPIVFNSSTGTTAANTASLNFIVTSSMGFACGSGQNVPENCWNPAQALSYGDGTNNYAWTTNATNVRKGETSSGVLNVTQLLTIQATGSNAGSWVPQPMAAGNSQTIWRSNPAESSPLYLNTVALSYPQFSALSNITAVQGINYDLVVMLQSGDYSQVSLVFMAVPSGTAGAVRR